MATALETPSDPGVEETLDHALELISDFVGFPFWSVDADSAKSSMAKTMMLESAMVELRSRLIAGQMLHDTSGKAGAASMTDWLHAQLRMDPAQAKAEVELARSLSTGDFQPVVDAFAAGRIHVGHARSVVAAMESLPKKATADDRSKVQAKLLEDAETLPPKAVRANGRTVLGDINPELADEVARKQAEKDERRAARQRGVKLTPMSDGRTKLYGILDDETAQRLQTALDPLSRPMPSDADGPDTRNHAQRQHDGLNELLRRYLASGDAGSHGGNGTAVILRITDTALVSGTGFGSYLRNGTPATAEDVTKHICGGKVRFTWFGDRDVDPFLTDVIRFFTGKLWLQLCLRDLGCAFPGCSRPTDWCVGHHIIPWLEGGPTTLNNGVLLCGHHHKVIHKGEWKVRRGADDVPEFIPPDFLDLDQKPLRNTMHRRP